MSTEEYITVSDEDMKEHIDMLISEMPNRDTTEWILSLMSEDEYANYKKEIEECWNS